MDLREYIAPDLLEKFEFYSYNHALEIITQAFPAEWSEIVDCLRQLRITTDDLRESGGNETKIPKKFDDVLYPRGWREIRISGDLHIKFYPRQAEQRGRFSQEPFEEKVIPGYIDGHNIDFLKTGSPSIWSGTAKIRRSTGTCWPCGRIMTATLSVQGSSLRALPS